LGLENTCQAATVGYRWYVLAFTTPVYAHALRTGQERYGNMTRVYYKEAIGAFVVFDITNSGTFEAVKKWKEDMDAKVTLAEDKPIPVVLLANKVKFP
jgi:hypothetical protein